MVGLRVNDRAVSRCAVKKLNLPSGTVAVRHILAWRCRPRMVERVGACRCAYTYTTVALYACADRGAVRRRRGTRPEHAAAEPGHRPTANRLSGSVAPVGRRRFGF